METLTSSSIGLQRERYSEMLLSVEYDLNQSAEKQWRPCPRLYTYSASYWSSCFIMNSDGKCPLIRTRVYLFGQRRRNEKTVGTSFSRNIRLSKNSKEIKRRRRTFRWGVNVEVEAIFALIGQHQLHPLELVIASSRHRLQTGRSALIQNVIYVIPIQTE